MRVLGWLSTPGVRIFRENPDTADSEVAPITELRGVVLEIFSRDQQVMGLLLPDAGPPELLGFDDRTMIYKDWEAQVHWQATNCAADAGRSRRRPRFD